MRVSRRSESSHRRVALTIASVLLLLSSFLGTTLVAQRSPTKEEIERWLREAEAFEARQTDKLLGVAVQNFPAPQGITGWDDLPLNRPPLRFSATKRAPKLPSPRPYFEPRAIVKAQAPDGSIYEGYSGRDEYELTPDHGIVSTYENTRQMYGTHHGYAYNPQDVYIGKRVNGRIKPQLFFRDVGSHNTAPFHFAVDSKGMVHLVVADVNIFQDNRLDLYWVIGDPATGKWTSAWLIDRRRFTSSSHTWTAAWGEKVNVFWTWSDQTYHKNAPGMGIFHLEWSPAGPGRKLRIVRGVPQTWDAAIDPQSGRILVAYAATNRVYLTSRTAGGAWTRPTLMNPGPRGYFMALSVASTGDDSFVVDVGNGFHDGQNSEWVVRIQP